MVVVIGNVWRSLPIQCKLNHKRIALPNRTAAPATEHTPGDMRIDRGSSIAQRLRPELEHSATEGATGRDCSARLPIGRGPPSRTSNSLINKPPWLAFLTP